MPDESKKPKQAKPAVAVDVLSDEEMPDAVESPESAELDTQPGFTQPQLIRSMWIAIAVLVFLLMLSMLPRLGRDSPSIAADDPQLAALRAELESRRNDLNRQRAELDLPPLESRGEAVEDITARLRKDADTLVSMATRSQAIIEEKDRKLTEQHIELVRAEQLRQSLSAELARIQAAGSDTTRLQSELAAALARANRLTDDLAAARSRIETLENATPSDEVETLKRRLEETTRARNFFEERAAELGKQLGGN